MITTTMVMTMKRKKMTAIAACLCQVCSANSAWGVVTDVKAIDLTLHLYHFDVILEILALLIPKVLEIRSLFLKIIIRKGVVCGQGTGSSEAQFMFHSI